MRRKRILIIDDDPAICKILERILKNAGHSPIVAEDLSEVPAAISKGMPDLILLDVTFPTGSGFDILKFRKTEQKLLRVPTIMLSSRKDKYSIVTAMTLGATDYMVKPINSATVLRKVKKALKDIDALSFKLPEKKRAGVQIRGKLIKSDNIAIIGWVPAKLRTGAKLKLHSPVLEKIGLAGSVFKRTQFPARSSGSGLYFNEIIPVGAKDVEMELDNHDVQDRLRDMNDRKVVVYDADDEWSEAIRKILKKFGLNVAKTKDAEHFSELVQKLKPHLVIVDVNLNDPVDGFKVLRDMSYKGFKKIPSIVLSKHESQSFITHALESGASDFLYKPINRNLLLSKVAYYLDPKVAYHDQEALDKSDDDLPDFQLDVDFKVTQVDELGFKFEGSHLVSKGQIVKIKSDLIKEVTGKEKPLSIQVTQNGVDTNGKKFWMYGELVSDDERIFQHIYNWLLLKTHHKEAA